MNDVQDTFWVVKDEEGNYRPLAKIWPAQGRIAEYVQDDIDKFLKKNPDCTVVKVKLVEVNDEQNG